MVRLSITLAETDVIIKSICQTDKTSNTPKTTDMRIKGVWIIFFILFAQNQNIYFASLTAKTANLVNIYKRIEFFYKNLYFTNTRTLSTSPSDGAGRTFTVRFSPVKPLFIKILRIESNLKYAILFACEIAAELGS